MIDFSIEDELKKLPTNPGVYIMHNTQGEIIYIGKAKNLKNRVKSYFRASTNHSIKTKHMVSHIAWFEYIITDNENEALTLECNLIKEHHPKYNIMLMDDKEYPYIKITTSEDYPRIVLSRKIENDYTKNKYYGPYVSNHSVKEVINLLKKIYHIRDCNKKIPFTNPNDRPCLNCDMGICDAPCINSISKEDYNKNVHDAKNFLNGNDEEIIKYLKQLMKEKSDNLEYEEANKYKEILDSISKISVRQKISHTDNKDRDIIGFYRKDATSVIEIFFIRAGKMIGQDHLFIKTHKDETNEKILHDFLIQFYCNSPFISPQIYTPFVPENIEEINDFLSSKMKYRVEINIPIKGEKNKFVQMASDNAKMVYERDREHAIREKNKIDKAMNELKELLSIDSLSRIEAYDISNIAGEYSVGGMVVYENGKKKVSDYRKFNIKTVVGPNDYDSLKEVLQRRFNRLNIERENKMLTSFSYLPDIIMMDGGKGQVNVALEVLDEYGLNIDVCGLVKDDNHRTRGICYNNREIAIDRHSEAFNFITNIQDEVHRFTIETHRRRRSKGEVHSILDDIKGVGPVTRKILRANYVTIENIKKASIDELANIKGISRLQANRIYEFFH